MTENPFERGGAGYAASRPSYPPELARVLAKECKSRDHALDVGCGNGQLSVLLAAEFEQITATDPSAEQLAHAVKHPRVSYRAGTAEKIDLPDASVDLITAAQAAHWFDLPAFYAEARRVARPGAKMALISYGIPELGGDAGAAFHTFYWGPFHSHWPKARAHVEQGYANIAFPFNAKSLNGITITRRWTHSDFAAYLATWSASRNAANAGERALLDDFLNELRETWGSDAVRRQITWPVTCRLGQLDEGVA